MENGNPLVRVLLNKNEWSAYKYILVMWPVAVVPAFLIGLTVFTIVWAMGADAGSYGPSFERDVQVRPWLFFYSAVVLVPFLESLIMGGLIRLIQNFTRRVFVVALVSAIVWAVLHSLAAPLWGLGVFWGFFLFSVAFVVWSREKFMKGVWVATAVHGLNNLTAVSMYFLL